MSYYSDPVAQRLADAILVEKKFNPLQPRDGHGRWTHGAGSLADDVSRSEHVHDLAGEVGDSSPEAGMALDRASAALARGDHSSAARHIRTAAMLHQHDAANAAGFSDLHDRITHAGDGLDAMADRPRVLQDEGTDPFAPRPGAGSLGPYTHDTAEVPGSDYPAPHDPRLRPATDPRSGTRTAPLAHPMSEADRDAVRNSISPQSVTRKPVSARDNFMADMWASGASADVEPADFWGRPVKKAVGDACTAVLKALDKEYGSGG